MKSGYEKQVSGERLEIGEKVICLKSKHSSLPKMGMGLVKGKTYTIFDRHHYQGQFIYKLESDGSIVDWMEQAKFPWNENKCDPSYYEDPRYFISLVEFREEKLKELGL